MSLAPASDALDVIFRPNTRMESCRRNERVAGRKGEGVLTGDVKGAPEETRERAERVSVVSGSGCPLSASVRAGKRPSSPKRTPSPDRPGKM
jgi:hypothetical protein